MPLRTRSTMSERSSSASPDDHDDGAAQRAARVDLLAEADELDAERVQLVEYLEEVPGGAGDAIAGPDQHDIEAAAAGIPHQIIQTGPRQKTERSGRSKEDQSLGLVSLADFSVINSGSSALAILSLVENSRHWRQPNLCQLSS